MALWDLAGKTLGVPTTTLLGGRFRDRVRMYDHSAPRDMSDPASCREWAQKVKSDPAGFTAHKFGFPHTDPRSDPARDPSNRSLTTTELSRIRRGFENCREAIGWDHDLMVHCHWEYDLPTSIRLAEAVEAVKPLWLEDPLPPEYCRGLAAADRRLEGARSARARTSAAGRRSRTSPSTRGATSSTPTSATRAASSRASGSPTSPRSSTCRWRRTTRAAWSPPWRPPTGPRTVRNFLASETVVGRGDWMDDVVVHDGRVVRDGFIRLADRPGLGLELDPDVVKAHLTPGESYWI